jgi:hypothetical protein
MNKATQNSKLDGIFSSAFRKNQGKKFSLGKKTEKKHGKKKKGVLFFRSFFRKKPTLKYFSNWKKGVLFFRKRKSFS